MDLTQQNLKKRFKYDPETGCLWWVKRDGSLRIAGSLNEEGYVAVTLGGKRYRAHRIIWIMEFGCQTEAIDHLNGVRSDNRLSNLRAASVSENNKNVRRRVDNTTGATGVYRSCKKNGKPWRAQIAAGGKDYPLGHYDTFSEALAARKAAEGRFGFHENHGRSETI